ncbi:MAG: hypothetical protein Q4E47_03655 [Candidatus Saccharibacteria bacterium]|nr:hypothetical protein [Candidatus Saccharibacteria bacterium]
MKTWKDKTTLGKINTVLLALFSLTGVVMTILYYINPEVYPKIGSYLVTIILPLLPRFLKLIRLELSDQMIFIALIFAILSMIFGIDFDFYKNWYIFGNPCYDKIAHILSGVVFAFVGKEIMLKFYPTGKEKKDYHRGFATLFIIGFVALTAAGWECYEFLYDQITGGHMQELIAPGVADTMWDILGALGAGIITAFFISKKK